MAESGRRDTNLMEDNNNNPEKYFMSTTPKNTKILEKPEIQNLDLDTIPEKMESFKKSKWQILKFSNFSKFEYNGDNKNIIKILQKKIRSQNFNKKEKFKKFKENKLNRFENKNILLKSTILLTGLLLFVTFKVTNKTNFLIILTFVLIFYLKIANLRKLFSNTNSEIEKIKNKFEGESNNNNNNETKFEADEGNLIKISSLFEDNIENVVNFFNNISNYDICDKNILKSEIDKSKEFKGFLYTLSLKEENKCFWGNFYNNNINKNENNSVNNETNNNDVLIKREIIDKKDISILIDFIKINYNDQEKILRVIHLENIKSNELNNSFNNASSVNKTLETIFIPIENYINKENNKKLYSLFNSSLKLRKYILFNKLLLKKN